MRAPVGSRGAEGPTVPDADLERHGSMAEETQITPGSFVSILHAAHAPVK
ncbi:hypothetical protein GCM10009674_06020 [Nesterenkonia xinjiangensis]